MTRPVYLVKGDDPVLRTQALSELLDELMSPADRALGLDDRTLPGRAGDGDGGSTAADRAAMVTGAIDAALSPPFMTERRVIVLRDVGHLTADDAEPIVRYLADPMDTSVLVFVAGGGRLPASLTKAWKGIVEQRGPESEKTVDVLADQLAHAGLTLDARAKQLLTEHLGGDAGRVPAIIELLASTYGQGTRLGAAEIEPYLGAAGSVPIWALTNAIESGDAAAALGVLERLLTITSPTQPKPMHPLQIVATVQNWLRRLALLDDAGIRSEQDAVAALGGKVKPYPAKKALNQARTLGTRGIRSAYDLVWQADLDLKGSRAIPPETVAEILVVRLAALSRGSGRRGSTPPGSSGRLRR